MDTSDPAPSFDDMADAITTSGSAYREKLLSLSLVSRPTNTKTTTDNNGHKVTEHRDGRVDTVINAEPVEIK